MTISHVSNGPTRNGISTVVAEYPTSVEAGNLLLWLVNNKYPSAAPNTPTGFTQLAQASCSTGDTPGADAGDVTATVFSKIGDGTEDAATQTMAVTGGNSAQAIMKQYARSGGTGWDVAVSSGVHNANTAAWSVSSGDSLSLAPGDVVVVFVASNNDQFTGQSTRSLAATGITFGSYTETRTPLGTTQGDDLLVAAGHYTVSSGTATVPVTFGVTHTGSGNADKPNGVVMFVRLRESATEDETPVITVQPEDEEVDEGQTATFSITATDATTYQWKRKSGGIGIGADVVGGTGATTASYTTPATTLTGSNHNNGDSYYCVATNAFGDTASLEATLTVLDITPPDLTSPTGTGGSSTATGTVDTNKGEGTLYFLADASATQTNTYIVANGLVQVVSAPGTKSVNFGTLSAGTKYGHYAQVDASGNVSPAVHSASFVVTAASGTIVTDPLRNNAGSLLASTNIAKVAVVRLSDLVQVATLADQETSAGGVLTLSGGSYTPGVAYIVLTSSTDGAATGSKTYTAV